MAAAIGSIAITEVSQKTFIISDQIILKAKVERVPAGTEVRWSVFGFDAANRIDKYLPKNISTKTNQLGEVEFRFTPSMTKELVNDRKRFTLGGNSPVTNPPISFEIKAVVTYKGVENQALLSQSLGVLTQDEIDTLRQEYFDYKTHVDKRITIPARKEFVKTLAPAYAGARFNTGNYNYQLSDGLDKRFANILASYRGRAVTTIYNGREYSTQIPSDAKIFINSAYRNPQRNRDVGSKHPNSRHVFGAALDLKPSSVVTAKIIVDGKQKTVQLSLHGTVYPALAAAAATQGTAIAENGSGEVKLGDPKEDHIHVQW
jgi:hypothetical protein